MVIYRPPNSNIELFLNEIEKNMNKFKGRGIIYVGDINLDINNVDNRGIYRYKTLMAENGLQKGINKTTRVNIVSENKEGSYIDHIYTRVKNYNALTAVIEVAIADHYMIGVKLIGNENNKEIKRKDSIVIIDDTSVIRQLKKVNWEDMLTINDTNMLYEKIVKTFNEI